jgi:hypothetical protein
MGRPRSPLRPHSCRKLLLIAVLGKPRLLIPLDVAHHSGNDLAHRSDLISPTIPRLSRPPFRDDVARGDEASSGSATVPLRRGTWMPTERFAMRHVRDVIRLKSAGMPTREIVRRLGTAPSTVRLTIRRFEAAGLSWPLPDGVTDTELEARLFASAVAGLGTPAGPSPTSRAGLGGAAPRAPTQARDAIDPVGGVHRGRARRVSLFALL